MRIAVIGSGIAGMSLGYYLARGGHKVTIYEKENRLGGLARSFYICGNLLEEYYHIIYPQDKYTVSLIKELGLQDRVEWSEYKMAMYLDNQLYPFSSLIDLFRFRPLSFINKVKFVLSLITFEFTAQYKDISGLTTEEFIVRSAGKEVYDKIWKPLLLTKFGENYYRQVSAAWLQSRIRTFTKIKKNIFKKNKVGYLKGSLKVLFDSIKKEIIKMSGEVINDFFVEKVDMSNDGKIIIRPSNDMYDAVCFCIPNPIIAKIAGHIFTSDYLLNLQSIKHKAILCVVLVLKEKLSPFYWINICKKDIPFAGLIEHTNLVNKKDYENNSLVYMPRYIDPGEEQFQLDDSELIELYSKHLKVIFPDFDKLSIKQAFVFRDLYAQPIMDKNYEKFIPLQLTPKKNVFINNMAQIYPQDRGLSEGILKSWELSKLINESC